MTEYIAIDISSKDARGGSLVTSSHQKLALTQKTYNQISALSEPYCSGQISKNDSDKIKAKQLEILDLLEDSRRLLYTISENYLKCSDLEITDLRRGRLLSALGSLEKELTLNEAKRVKAEEELLSIADTIIAGKALWPVATNTCYKIGFDPLSKTQEEIYEAAAQVSYRHGQKIKWALEYNTMATGYSWSAGPKQATNPS